MPLRSLVEPEEFFALEMAFEEAWAAIDAPYKSDPLRVPAQRERLAHILIGLWKSGIGDRAELVNTASQTFVSVFSEVSFAEKTGESQEL